jgi:hypothetical protein
MLEMSQLLPLPATPFELANWSEAKVNIDYHVVVEKHFYSAPHPLIHQQLDVRLTDQTVELFQHGKRVAAHLRSHLPGRFTTLEQHRPKSHQKHCNASRILSGSGPSARLHQVVEKSWLSGLIPNKPFAPLESSARKPWATSVGSRLPARPALSALFLSDLNPFSKTT